MKNTLIRIVLALATLLPPVSLYAGPSNVLRVNIPFDFIAGSQKMAAGEYTVQESGEAGMVILYNVSARQSAILLSEPEGARSDHEPGLTFERRDGSAYLVRLQPGTGSTRLVQVKAR